MDQILLIFSIISFFAVMRLKKISPVSLYALFGLQWFFYLIFPLFLSYDIVPVGLFAGYPLNYDKELQFYFILFNAGAMLAFVLAYFLFYKKNSGVSLASLPDRFLKYRQPLFIIQLVACVIIIILSILYPYKQMTWWSHSINANLRNFVFGLFIFYMLLRPNKWKIALIVLLFAVSTVVYGGRVYLLIMITSLMFYLYDAKTINLKHIVATFLLMIVLLTSVGLLRDKMITDWGTTSRYFLIPMYAEGVFSSYSGFAVLDLWRRNAIQYHTYFGSYIVDPVMIFVPQFVFISQGVSSKGGYNILGKWEDDHGGRPSISPQGGYYYMAEAIQALSIPGIFIVVFVFALICIGVERLRVGGVIGQFTYYSFVGAFGLGFVSDQFAWCFRSFGMNFEVLVFFLIVYEVLRRATSLGKIKQEAAA